jgi:hypothetical protein
MRRHMKILASTFILGATATMPGLAVAENCPLDFSTCEVTGPKAPKECPPETNCSPGDGESGNPEGDGGGQFAGGETVTKESIFKKAEKATQTWKKPCIVRGESAAAYVPRGLKSCIDHVVDQLPWTVLVSKERAALQACDAHRTELITIAMEQAPSQVCGG